MKPNFLNLFVKKLTRDRVVRAFWFAAGSLVESAMGRSAISSLTRQRRDLPCASFAARQQDWRVSRRGQLSGFFFRNMKVDAEEESYCSFGSRIRVRTGEIVMNFLALSSTQIAGLNRRQALHSHNAKSVNPLL